MTGKVRITKVADWDKRFMDIADTVAGWSKDRSRKMAAIIVGPDNEIRSVGYNGFPRGCNDDLAERHERPEKYFWTEHAERNAVYNAVRVGVSLAGCRLYVPWFPCMACGRSIVQSGIAEVICFKPDLGDPMWGPDFERVLVLLEECEVGVKYHNESDA